jgi:large subunit ribosomal protein L35Ae
MEGTIVNFRTARHHQYDNHMVIKPEGYSEREKAKSLVGKTVVWTTETGKEIKGKVASAHGNSGAIRAIFEKGMPGQSVGTKIKIQ